ncbi:MAG TPA: copper chaperone PCu(A)C [Polyangiaceae bacterium]|nr:copper chaperone PCu(A)C [Polyangiaceae bacterium]
MSACSTARARSETNLTVEDASARVLASGAGVLYFSVRNDGPGAERLKRVDVPLAADAQLHEIVEQQGVSRMDPAPNGFQIPGHSTLSLAHGGKHVMLFGVHLPHGASQLEAVAFFERSGAIPFKARLSDGQ